MTWVVRLTLDGGQRDGRIYTYHTIEMLADLGKLPNAASALDIHLVRTQGRNAAEVVYQAVTGRPR